MHTATPAARCPTQIMRSVDQPAPRTHATILRLERSYRLGGAAASAAGAPGADLPFLGTPMRSALGWALRRLACITHAPQCGGCPVRSACAYGCIFDPAPAAQPLHPSLRDGIPAYVLHPPAWPQPANCVASGPNQEVRLGISLLPPAQPHLELLLLALERAWSANPSFLGGCRPITGWSRSSTSTLDLTAPGHPAPTATPAQPATEQPTPEQTARLTLHFHTPLRLEQRGHIVANGAHLRVADLGRACAMRLLQWRSLLPSQPDQPDQPNHPPLPIERDLPAAWASCQLDARALRCADQHRYSQRQGQSHPIGGLVGPLHLYAPRAALAPLHAALRLCQRLHLGKRTAFGLGGFSLHTSP